MPELPEVETTRQGIRPCCEGKAVRQLRVFEPRLRWPVPDDLPQRLEGATIHALKRRGKYLLLIVDEGAVLVHLGMSGSVRVVTESEPRRTHDHLELEMEDGALLRYHDPRRFGCWLWSDQWEQHPLIRHLGPEPLSPEFTGEYLYRLSRGRQVPVKSFLMDSKTVVGVGNIYANESLFKAGILPGRAAGRIGLDRYKRLVTHVRDTLSTAITQGGTTLRDFVNSSGQPGYFAQSLQVYGREGQPCRLCNRPLSQSRLGQRTTVFCRHCQR